MGRKIGDIPTKISFKTERVHIVELDPAQESETRNSRDGGDYEVFLVRENGSPAYLSGSSNRLIQQIQGLRLTVPSRLRITRQGDGFDTTYAVENLGPVITQAPLG